jgi:hypothetical protein
VKYDPGTHKGMHSVLALKLCATLEHVNDVKGYVFGARVLGGAKRHRQGDDPNRLNSLPTEAIEGLHRFLALLSIKTHFSLATIIDEDFSDVPSVDVDGDNHGICVGERG